MLLRKFPTPLLFSSIAIMLLLGLGQCFGQDSLRFENVLMVQRVLPDPGQKAPEVYYFKNGNRVNLLCSNYLRFKGRIDAIDDSGILVKGMYIKTEEIMCMHRIKGRAIRITGGSFIGAGALIMGITELYYSSPSQANNKYSVLGKLDSEIPAIGLIIAGAITTLVGTIDLISVKHYDIGWKFSIGRIPYRKK
jgi:hypothetical protein